MDPTLCTFPSESSVCTSKIYVNACFQKVVQNASVVLFQGQFCLNLSVVMQIVSMVHNYEESLIVK